MTSSSRSATPRPCIALTGYGSPSPSDHSAAASASPRSLSTLLAARNTGLPDRCSSRAAASSAVGRAHDRVDHEDDRVGGAHRHRRLLGHQLLQTLCVGLPAAGVLHDEPPPRPSSRRRTPGRGSPRARPAPPPRGGRGSGSPASTCRRSGARRPPPPAAAPRLPRSPRRPSSAPSSQSLSSAQVPSRQLIATHPARCSTSSSRCATTSGSDMSLVSTTNASSAARSGDTARVESRWSRRFTSASTAS